MLPEPASDAPASAALVSVVIPVYRRPDLLVQAISSCYLDLSAGQVEVIVVDDASPESLEAVVSATPARYLRLVCNSGACTARNEGVALANGKYLKFLDSDDVLLPGGLANELRAAEEHQADIVVSAWRVGQVALDGGLESVVDSRPPEISSIVDDLLAGRGVPTGAALYRRELVRDVRWDRSVSPIDDWDYFLQCALRARKIVSQYSPVYAWRTHAGQRITTDASAEEVVRGFYVILDKLVAEIERRGQLTNARKARAAQYMYKELRRLYRIDRPAARGRLQRILQLDPAFRPRDEEPASVFRLAGRLRLLRLLLECYSLIPSKFRRRPFASPRVGSAGVDKSVIEYD